LHLSQHEDLASKSRDKAAFTETNTRWAQNGNDIADFLSTANPHGRSAPSRRHRSQRVDEPRARRSAASRLIAA
jgi:hypothetical protein